MSKVLGMDRVCSNTIREDFVPDEIIKYLMQSDNHALELEFLVLVIGLKYESPRPNPSIMGWKDQCLSWARQNFSDDSFMEGHRIPYVSRTGR